MRSKRTGSKIVPIAGVEFPIDDVFPGTVVKPRRIKRVSAVKTIKKMIGPNDSSRRKKTRHARG